MQYTKLVHTHARKLFLFILRHVPSNTYNVFIDSPTPVWWKPVKNRLWIVCTKSSEPISHAPFVVDKARL